MDESLRTERDRKAEAFFETDLRGQRDWYSKRASSIKSRADWSALLIIAGGSLIAVISALRPGAANVFDVAVIVLGGLIAVTQGIQRIWKFDEIWPAYRRASELMKRERRLYANNAGPYADLSDEDEAYRAFVERIEAIIAEEQNYYFDLRMKKTDAKGDEAS